MPTPNKPIKLVNRKPTIKLKHNSGKTGPAGEIIIGDTTTLAPNTDATVINVGTNTHAILEFGIPQGIQGDPATNLVTSVNGEQGVVVLDAADVGADSAGSASNALSQANDYTDEQIGDLATVASTGSYDDLLNKPTIPTVPVTSVNGELGDVVLTSDDVADTATNRYTNDSDITRLANTSGTNTGDQDLSGLATDAELTAGLATKEPTITAGTTSQYYRGDKTWQTLNTTAVGIPNVNNTSDMDKPVSTAQGVALAGKATLLSIPQSTVPYRSLAGSGEPNTSFALSAGTTPSTIATRDAAGALSGATPTQVYHLTRKDYVDTFMPLAGGNFTGNVGTLRLAPVANLTHDLGTASLYYSNSYVRRQYFNSTAYMDGSTAGQMTITGQLNVPVLTITDATNGISTDSTAGFMRISGGAPTNGAVVVLGGSTHDSLPSIGELRVGFTSVARWSSAGLAFPGVSSATHSATFGSTATGIALYNTVDQTTNYERVRQYWSGGVFNILNEIGGTGAPRAIRLGVYSGGLFISSVSTLTQGFIRADQGAVSGNQSIFSVNGNLTASSAIQAASVVAPTINQSGPAGYTLILGNATEAATGSGPKNLMDLQVNGVSRFKVSNTGATSIIDGTQGAGKVLTSDASGNASWQAPSGGGSGITRSIITTSGNVTAGATASTDYVYIITGAHTVTLPTAVGNTNKYDLNNASGSPVSLAFTSGQTANGGGVTLGVNESITLISDNANWRIL